jgi:hypothetical protein
LQFKLAVKLLPFKRNSLIRNFFLKRGCTVSSASL